MSHALLALTLAATLLLNGSMALATMPTPCAPPGTGVCAVPLRMMTPPPPRPLDLMARHQRAAPVVFLTAAR
ncbi:MAG: hypothetical protein H6898_14820 [Rhodobacter sp.]|nr:hypothetical protein [Paracoccaceae bacterium]MCC0077831.1 hypothetical protein [Rhodobacter sp.]